MNSSIPPTLMAPWAELNPGEGRFEELGNSLPESSSEEGDGQEDEEGRCAMDEESTEVSVTSCCCCCWYLVPRLLWRQSTSLRIFDVLAKVTQEWYHTISIVRRVSLICVLLEMGTTT